MIDDRTTTTPYLYLASCTARSTALKSSSSWPLRRAVLYISLAAAATGISCPSSSPSASASRMSFCWCFRGNAWGKVPLIMLGPFRANMGALMAPREMTCSITAGSRSAFSVRDRPSEKDAIMEPITMFTTSFILAPAPTSPRKKCALPITSSGPVTRSYSALSPAAMKISAPCSAGALEPDTGASRNSAPVARMMAAAACEVPASTVETST
mmetsp:Transcript_20515/g.51133  ORF Transcript_20515/g.51133 Transcript_20515/m.51133 type:complete len:212 (-) Transcript_20515:39-674(-)